MLDTYGMKIKGIKEASGETCNWDSRSGCHTQISYDRRDGQVLTDDLVGNDWVEYHSSSIITVCNTTRKMTMQEIVDAIKLAVDTDDATRSYLND